MWNKEGNENNMNVIQKGEREEFECETKLQTRINL